MKRGQTIVITGGNRGIGKVIAETFLKAGWDVAVCSRSARCSDLPSAIRHFEVDVRNRAAIGRFLEEGVRETGRLDCFVNCAGASRWKPLHEIDEQFVTEIVETNLLGTLWGSQAAAPYLREGGTILNVSSLAGKRGSANNTAYCAAKFAVNGITQSLAKELGPRGIRVNAVCPVYVQTPTILQSLGEPASPVGGQTVSDYLGDFAKTQTALKRLPTEQEIADLVFYLASDKANAITGQCINIDCGVLPS